MTNRFGLGAGAGGKIALAVIGLCALLVLVAAAVVLPVDAATVALWATAAASLALAAAGFLRARGFAEQAAKLSSELTTVSQRLLRLEAAPLLSPVPAPPPAAPPAEPAADGLDEITAEIGLMGEILRDLALAVAAHERHLASLRSELERGPPPRVAPPALAPAEASAAPPAAPEPATVAEPPPLDAAAERPVAAILAAFAGDRLELHLQPVVALPQRKVRLYEALARLRLSDDTLLVPAEFLPVLEARGLMPELDRKVLARSAAIARHLAARGSEALVACNLSPAALAEPGFLRGVGRLLDAHPDLPGRIVLELSQRCWRTLDAEKAGALAQLRDRGLSFALDRATDLRLDPLALADRGVRYLKIPAELLLQEREVAGGLDVEIEDLAAVLARAGIRLVAERVEREEDVPDLLDLDVPMAQGFVFAPPRPVRAEVLNPAAAAPVAAAPEPAAPALPAAASGGEPSAEPPRKMPFRAFLRRAS